MGFWLNEWFLAFGRVAATAVKGGAHAVLENLDASAGDKATGEPAFQSLGRYARAMPPVDPGQGTPLNPEGEAEFIGLRLGDHIHSIGAYRDLRLSKQVNPAEGAIGDVHYGGGFIEQSWNADKSGTRTTIYVPHKDGSGAPDHASVITVDSSPGNESILMLHKSGASISITPAGSVVLANAAGDAYLEVNGSGVVINGAAINITGGAVIGDANPASAVFLAVAQLVEVRLGEIAGAIAGAAVTSSDGGAALKANILAALATAGWAGAGTIPPTVATTKTKGV